MPRMRITLEDVLEIDRAIDMVENEDSTDPLDVAMVDDYKERLKKLQENDQDESTDDSGEDTFSESTDEESPGDASTDSSDDEVSDDVSSADETSDEDENTDEGDKTDKDSNDADEETESKDTEEIADKSKEADKALEHLIYALECYEQLQDIKLKGAVKRQSTMSEFAQTFEQFKDNAKLSGITLKQLPSLESWTESSYVNTGMQIEAALEGITDYIKAAYEKVIAAIKWIYKWLKDYFFYDPVKDQKNDAIWRARREKLKELQKRTLSYQNYIRDMELMIGKKQYRDRANFIVIGNKDVTCDKAIEGIRETSKFLSQYWANTASFVRANVISKMSDVLDFDTKGAFFNANTGFLNFSFIDYQPVLLKEEKVYRSISSRELPSGFKIFLSQSKLCGDKRLALIMPEKPQPDIVKQTANGMAYDGFMMGDETTQGVRKAIFYTSNVSLLASFVEDVQRAQADKRKLSVFVNEVIRNLENTTRKMTGALETVTTSHIPSSIRTATIKRLRFNINVINNLFDKPLVASVYFFDRLYSAIDDFTNKNMTMIETVADDMEKKKEELGLNI